MKQWNNIKKIISYYHWALKLAMAEKRWWMLTILSTYVLIKLMPTVELLISKRILNQLEIFNISNIYILLGFLLFIMITVDVGNVVYMFFYEKIRYVISNQIFSKVLKNVDLMPYDSFENSQSNAYIERLINTSRYTIHNLISANLSFYSTIIQTVVYIIIIVITAPMMLIPMVAVAIIPHCYRMNEAKDESDLEYKLQESRRQIDYLDSVLINKKSIYELRQNHTYFKVMNQWERIYEKEAVERKTHKHIWRIKKLWSQIGGKVMDIGILGTLIVFYVNEKFDFGTLFFLWQGQKGINTSVGWFASIVPNSYGEVRKAEECKEFISRAYQSQMSNHSVNIPEEFNAAANSLTFKREPYEQVQERTMGPVKIQLHNVSYSYSNGEFNLEDINLEGKQGEIIVLLGENGSGKSTIIKLILGLYKSSKGTVKYYSNDQEVIPIGWFGCAFQDYSSYHVSLRENVGFGDISKISEEQQIIDKLRKNQCSDILDSTQNNIDKNLGRLFDLDGLELSGGQWQRLANCRALFGDKVVLVCDEPTASLDPIAELEQMKLMKSNLKDKLVFLVSHRIGFARMADCIYYVDNGRILETGSHDELMKKKSRYYEMFLSQSKWYDWGAYDE